MKYPFLNVFKALVVFCSVLAIAHVQGASLLLDFGPTKVASTEAMLDMGHFAGAVPATEISWNTMVNADNSVLIYSDGSTATGVSVVVGRSAAGVGNAVSFSNKSISSSALGSAEYWGIYTNTSPIKDGIFATGTATVATNVLAIRVDGLAAGTYTLYISGRNTSTGVSAAECFFATNGPSSANFSFSTNSTPWTTEANSGSAPGNLPNQANTITGTFAYGDNCALLTVTLNSGDSLFLAAVGIATNEFRGFLNAVDIVPGGPVLTNFPATIGVQPAGATAYAGSTITIGNVTYGGMPPLNYQWYFAGSPISGATNATLSLPNATTNNSGYYSVAVANTVATNMSSNALVTVILLDNTEQMTNIWNLLPGDRFYITANGGNNYERGLGYDPMTGDLLLVAQYPTNNVVVLNSTNGAEKYFMNLSGIAAGAGGANTIGVGDDGAVYVANVTANAASPLYTINRWSDDSSGTVATLMYSGDPGFGGPTGLRWGDNMVVRGAGLDTEILTAPGAGTNIVCLFTTDPSGAYMLPNLITVTNLPATNSLAQFGIAFGPGTNTFWAKTLNNQLFLVQFDLVSGQAGVIYSAPTSDVPNSLRMISTDGTQKWLAGIMSVNSSSPDNVRLYDISDYTNNPVLADQELFTTANQSTFLNGAGTGVTVFGGNYLFALDSNNGIKAFFINTNSVLSPFGISSIMTLPGSFVALTWQSVSGHNYQIQCKTNLTDAAWSNLGPAVPATAGTFTSATNTISAPTLFYRIQGQ